MNDIYIPLGSCFNIPKNLHCEDLVVFGVLLRDINENRISIADRAYIALLLRCSIHTVKAHIKKLIKAGMITHKGYNLNREPIYYVEDLETNPRFMTGSDNV